MDNITPDSDNEAAPKSGPGRMLRQARLDLRLAPEDIAQILHLSSKQITALEADDYQRLPGPTYIRGYLRSYSQLLGLVPEKVVEVYNNLIISSKPVPPPSSAPPSQITSSNHLVKAASVGVAVVVLGLVYLWWQSENESPERSRAPAVIGRAPVDKQVPSNDPGDKPATTEMVGGSVVGGSASPPDASSVEKAATPTATTSGQLTVSGMTLNVSPAEPPKLATPATPAPERAATRTRRAVEIPAGVLRSRMVLHAIQESWADVRDARDNKLLYENVPAGRRISIEGVAPFSVFVGNADGVRVEFNGQNFDVSRHKRGQVARFTLGKETAVNN
jgi:cytoskeleton protein RodZ